jgi:FAD/FMN-containing dehydrogenase
VNLAAMYRHPEEAPVHEAWVADFAASLRQGEARAYAGFLGQAGRGQAGEARIREVYPQATWERLAAVKRRYDPTNLFRLNHNIAPS